MTEKQKLYKKTVALVERLLAEGKTITTARMEAATKVGVCYPTVCRLTKHLSDRGK